MTLLQPAFTVDSTYAAAGPIAAHPEDRARIYYPAAGQAPRAGARPLAMYLHGAGNTYINSTGAGVSYIIGHLCNMGFVVIAADFGDPATSSGPTSAGASWGCATLTARIEAWRVWAAANIPNVYATKVTFFGASMGSANTLAYARDYTANFAAGVNLIPFCDMKWARDNRANGSWPGNTVIAPAIDSAWGLSSGSATPAACDLLTNASVIGVPWRSYTRSDDPLADPSRPPLMATHIGATATSSSVGAGLRTVTDGTTTNGTNVVGSATGSPAFGDVGKPISSGTAAIPASSQVAAYSGSTWVISTNGTPPLATTCTATTSGNTITVGQGHDETGWFQVDIDGMFSWLMPYALS